MKCGFVLVILAASVITGCNSKPKSERYKEFKTNISERNKFQHCYDKHSNSILNEHRLSESFYDAMLECRKKATDAEIDRSEKNRVIRNQKQQFINEGYRRIQNENNENIKAEEVLDIIRAKIKVKPKEYPQGNRKLIYCKTNPKWHEHGYKVARELEQDIQYKFKILNSYNSKPKHLEPRNILNCFETVTLETLSVFFNN